MQRENIAHTYISSYGTFLLLKVYFQKQKFAKIFVNICATRKQRPYLYLFLRDILANF